MRSAGRRLQGLLTVGVFGTFSALLWPDSPWIAGLLGALTLYRLVVLMRTWSESQ